METLLDICGGGHTLEQLNNLVLEDPGVCMHYSEIKKMVMKALTSEDDKQTLPDQLMYMMIANHETVFYTWIMKEDLHRNIVYYDPVQKETVTTSLLALLWKYECIDILIDKDLSEEHIDVMVNAPLTPSLIPIVQNMVHRHPHTLQILQERMLSYTEYMPLFEHALSPTYTLRTRSAIRYRMPSFYGLHSQVFTE